MYLLLYSINRVTSIMKASSSTQILLLWLGASNFCHRILLTADAFLSTGGPISLSRRHLYQSSSTSARFVLQDKLTSEEIHSRLEAQLAKLREKDRASKPISIDVRNHIIMTVCASQQV